MEAENGHQQVTQWGIKGDLTTRVKVGLISSLNSWQNNSTVDYIDKKYQTLKYSMNSTTLGKKWQYSY